MVAIKGRQGSSLSHDASDFFFSFSLPLAAKARSSLLRAEAAKAASWQQHWSAKAFSDIFRRDVSGIFYFDTMLCLESGSANQTLSYEFHFALAGHG